MPNTIKVIRIDVDGKISGLQIPDTLEAMQEQVGGYIEMIILSQPNNLNGNCSLVGYVNEEGKPKNLPFNPLATKLCLDRLFFGDYINGPMIISAMDDQGNSVSIPDSVGEEIVKEASKIMKKS